MLPRPLQPGEQSGSCAAVRAAIGAIRCGETFGSRMPLGRVSITSEQMAAPKGLGQGGISFSSRPDWATMKSAIRYGETHAKRKMGVTSLASWRWK